MVQVALLQGNLSRARPVQGLTCPGPVLIRLTRNDLFFLDYCNNRGVDPTEPIELVLPKDYGAKTSYDTEISVIYDQDAVVPELIDLEVESEKVDGEEEIERVVIEFQERPDFRSDRDFGRESESSYVLTQITILLLITCLFA